MVHQPIFWGSMTKIDSDHSVQNWRRYWVHETFFFFKMKSLMPWIMQTAVTMPDSKTYTFGVSPIWFCRRFSLRSPFPMAWQHGRWLSEILTASTKALQSWSSPLARQTWVSDAWVKWLARPNHRLPPPPVSPHMSQLVHRHWIPPLPWTLTYRRHDLKLGSATTARKLDISQTIAQSPISNRPEMTFQKRTSWILFPKP